MVDEVAVAQAPTADWDAAEREARRAATFVGMFVGVPAAIAAGAALMIFALAWLVLLAPLVATVLTWTAWRYGRADHGPRGAGSASAAKPR
jgi:membrane protein implicated in regulation of membrane protease activity